MNAFTHPTRPHVASRRNVHVDDLPELVDRPVDIAPAASDLHIGLVHAPAPADGMSAGPGRLSQQWREALDPAVDGGVVDLDAALGEQLLDIAVGQREAQVPPHRQHDDVWVGSRSRRRRTG
jgi:hypothetical protein